MAIMLDARVGPPVPQVAPTVAVNPFTATAAQQGQPVVAPEGVSSQLGAVSPDLLAMIQHVQQNMPQHFGQFLRSPWAQSAGLNVHNVAGMIPQMQQWFAGHPGMLSPTVPPLAPQAPPKFVGDKGPPQHAMMPMTMAGRLNGGY